MPALAVCAWTLTLKHSETVTAETDPSKTHTKRLHKGMARMNSECFTPFNLVGTSSGRTTFVGCRDDVAEGQHPPPPPQSRPHCHPRNLGLSPSLTGRGGFPDFPAGLCHHKGLYKRGMEAGEPESDRDRRS